MKYFPLIVTPLLFMSSLVVNAGFSKKEISTPNVTTVYASAVDGAATELKDGGVLSLALVQSINQGDKLSVVLHEASKKTVLLSKNRQQPRIEGSISDPNRLLCGKNNTYIISIGVNTSPKMKMSILRSAEKDANNIAFAFEQTCGAQKTLLIGEKAQRDDILKAINKVSQQANKDDAIIVSYSGHGLGTSQGNVLTLYDTEQNSSARSAVTVKDVQRLLSTSNANSLLVLDACFSSLIK